jgi:hypothetical protein
MVMPTENPLLHALARRIQVTVTETGRCLLTAPSELAPLKALGEQELQVFAAEHGWTAVPRLGFSQLEFFATHVARVPANLE